MQHHRWVFDEETDVPKVRFRFPPYSPPEAEPFLFVKHEGSSETHKKLGEAVLANTVYDFMRAFEVRSGAIGERGLDALQQYVRLGEHPPTQDGLRSLSADKPQDTCLCTWFTTGLDLLLDRQVCLPKEPARRCDVFDLGSSRPHPSESRMWECVRKLLLPPVEQLLTSRSRRLESAYSLRKPIEVAEFLVGHQELAPVLFDAYEKIREEIFFPSADLALDHFVDPELDEQQAEYSRRLIIVVITQLSVGEAMERYRLLQENWWLDTYVTYGDRLGLDLEFE